MYIGQCKYVSFFNEVAFVVRTLVLPRDEVSDSITVELFPQIPHNGTDFGNQLVTCGELFPPQVCLYL